LASVSDQPIADYTVFTDLARLILGRSIPDKYNRDLDIKAYDTSDLIDSMPIEIVVSGYEYNKGILNIPCVV
jgi:hypothetical protein